MSSSVATDSLSPRRHPKLAELFKQAEGRHFTDEELDIIEREFPQLTVHVSAAREIRTKDVGIISRVVKEVYSQYPYEKHHEFALAKCPRDIRYVVCYAVQAMIASDPAWFDNKVLIWLKTILQAFEFPERVKSSVGALFSDPVLEEKLKQLPKKSKSVFHTYYRLKQEMGKDLKSEHFKLIAPYLEQSINTLTEKY
ncbi:MAG: hypothetical protein JNN15_06620 [Blastocatellia bacterium]|nr:hypothetical protein [Blastocatellia bacterium]